MPLGINPFCQEVFFYMAQIFVCGYYFPDNKLLLLLLLLLLLTMIVQHQGI